jgi:hypothetical protein
LVAGGGGVVAQLRSDAKMISDERVTSGFMRGSLARSQVEASE